ncbi:uncharacterized conserved protein [Longilinea arvoryzae]|uniref:Uncharacterized conserved protein n=1 Tax=Longilinea arvoryzae TaxID=360412 RepID=A0A0S7BA53_9CHLR|nr:DUF309 domain-containing protein [Longilinea arvoryzae]GAP14460.1 uncharacterized conserved protein [Longilinea arvoryzae]
MESADSPIPCTPPLPETVLRGLASFNAGRYFEAHEYLETAWRAESRPIRELYQGILQVGVGYYHLQRGNLAGARKVFQRARLSLAKFGATACGIDIAGLLVDVDRVEDAMQDPDHLARRLEAGLLRPIRFVSG